MVLANKEKRPLLILDLDETLIFASNQNLGSEPDFHLYEYQVYLRPGLRAFLRERNLFFDIAIWSSGSEAYVSSIVEIIMPEPTKPAFVWSRKRCTLKQDLELGVSYFKKDLKKVEAQGYDLARTLIVEDTWVNVKEHYGNAIYISKFKGDLQDSELAILGPFLDKLSKTDDFRKIEKANWRV